MPFRRHCIDILSRGSDLQFDSRPMEIYGAVNLIDSALTRRAGSFVLARARARMSDIKKLSVAQWPAYGFLRAMTRRECNVA